MFTDELSTTDQLLELTTLNKKKKGHAGSVVGMIFSTICSFWFAYLCCYLLANFIYVLRCFRVAFFLWATNFIVITVIRSFLKGTFLTSKSCFTKQDLHKSISLLKFFKKISLFKLTWHFWAILFMHSHLFSSVTHLITANIS